MNKNIKDLKVAIIHDFFIQIGGAEKILCALVELFPQAEIFTIAANDRVVQELIPNQKLTTSFIQRLPFSPKFYRIYLFLMPKAIESFRLDGFDLVISITSAFAKGVITHPPTVHVCYLNTPTRYLWDISDYYLKTSVPWGLRTITKYLIFPYLKYKDIQASKRPDYIIPNSNTIDERTKRVYDRSGDQIIYPFVDTNKIKSSNKPDKGYFLLAGRLVPYKRNDIVIKAFNELKLPLLVVGTGSDYKKLVKLNTNPKTIFKGRVSDNQLLKYYQNCKAYIFPAYEDFGITPVEAMAAGRPVIAYGRGGATETVINNKTGVFFKHQTPDDVIKAIHKFNALKFSKSEIISRGLQFSKNRFINNMKQFINKKL